MIAFIQDDVGEVFVLGEAVDLADAIERYGKPSGTRCICVAKELPNVELREKVLSPAKDKDYYAEAWGRVYQAERKYDKRQKLRVYEPSRDGLEGGEK